MGLITNIKKSLYSVASQYLGRAVLVEGQLRNTGEPFRCLFVGKSLMKYLLPKMYEGSPAVLKEWKIWIPSLKRYILNPTEKLNLCIAALPLRYDAMFHELYDFKGQEYVRQIIDTSGTWEDIRGRFHKKKRQITNNLQIRHNLNYRISQDQKDFDFFYYRMFIPHIKKQFRDIASIDSYEEIKQYFLKGFLLLVVSANQPVAGALCLVEDNVLIFRRTGVLDGDDCYIKCGAQMALYYFLLLYAKEKNLKMVDTMKSQSFLCDGVYRTKREWGAVVRPDDESKAGVYFFILNDFKKAVNFFDSNPVIINTNNGLSGLIGWNGSAELSDDNKKELIKKFYAQGLEEIHLLTMHSKTPIRLSSSDIMFNKAKEEATAS